MCSIMGYCGTVMTIKDFKTGFDKTVSRGPDMSRIIDTGKGLLGFHRLAIMGLDESGMQPFAFGGNYVVCNGEIYGFRKLKKELEEKGYKFVSDSDCELLLPLVRVGGKAVALKGPGAAAEAEAAQNALEALDGQLFAIEEVPIPGRDWAHTLAVLAKTAPTPEKYPRRVGVPEKRPL